LSSSSKLSAASESQLTFKKELIIAATARFNKRPLSLAIEAAKFSPLNSASNRQNNHLEAIISTASNSMIGVKILTLPKK